MSKQPEALFPEVNFSHDGPIRHLHLGSDWIQGSMLLGSPTVLVHEYIQRMMAGLLFIDPAYVSECQALQLGLGAASLTKFCYHELRMRTTAIEINPQVVAFCREWFELPQDNARLHVVLGDAAQAITAPYWRNTVDALHVDVYDQEAAAPVLDSADFYAACREVLTAQGCMTVNLFGRVASYAHSVNKMAAAFGREALWAFKSTREGNTVVLAQRNASRPKRRLLLQRAAHIRAHWGLPADRWLRDLKALQP